MGRGSWKWGLYLEATEEADRQEEEVEDVVCEVQDRRDADDEPGSKCRNWVIDGESGE